MLGVLFKHGRTPTATVTDRSGGVRREVLSQKDQMLAPIRWAYFGDDACPRVLFVAQVQPDDVVDNLWFLAASKGDLMTAENGMTVFGLGRDHGSKGMLRGAGQEFIVGFLEQKATDGAAHARIAAAIEQILASVEPTPARKS